MIDPDEEAMGRLAGLYVGQLTENEMAAFVKLVKKGLAYRSYTGAGGMLGLAKVGILPTERAAKQ